MNATAKNLLKFLLVTAAIIAALYYISINTFDDEYKVHVTLLNVKCLANNTEVYYAIRNTSDSRVAFLRIVITAENKADGKKHYYQVKSNDGILGHERLEEIMILPRYDCNQTNFTIEVFTF